MGAAQLKELPDDRAILKPLTVEQYHEMLRSGILEEGEPFELLDGCLVQKDRSAAGGEAMTVSTDHATAVLRLGELNGKLKPQQCHMRTQQPVSLPPFDEPEPDGAIVRGSIEDYRDRHPGAEDVLCVIEVADASLRRDRTAKLRIYGSAGIKRYIIVNLPDRSIEVYTEPSQDKGRYGRSETLTGGQSIEIPTGKKTVKVAVRNLLP